MVVILASYPKNPQVGFRGEKNRGNGEDLSENVRNGDGLEVKNDFG